MSSPAKAPARSQAAPSSRLVPIVEIAVGYGLIQGALWTPGHARYTWAWLALAWIVGVTLYHRAPLREIGMGRRGLRQSLGVVLAGMAFAAAALGIGFASGSLHDYSPHGFAARALGYLIWAFEQEFILQSFIFVRLESLLRSSSRAVAFAAVLFSLAHIPSPVLTLGSLFMAWIFCEVFRRHRNIYPLALAHWMVGLSLSLVLPEVLSHHMRVGIGYLHFMAR